MQDKPINETDMDTNNPEVMNGDSQKKKSKKSKRAENKENGEGEVMNNVTECDEKSNGKSEVKKSKKRKAEEENTESASDNVEKVEENGEETNGKKKKKFKKSEADEEAATEVQVAENGVLNGEKKKKKSKSKKDVSETEPVEESATVEQVVEPGDFSNFRISPAIIERLKAKGINALFPVQIDSFDLIYDNFDAIVQARTGSGKTLSFALPLVEKLMQKVVKTARRPPQVLVMAPTRELAKQVADTFTDIATGLSVACVYGGTPIQPQDRLIRSGVDILVGTPGRIQDLVNRGTLDLTQLSFVVLDEVDRMLDMGFADDVDQILSLRYVEGDYEKNPQTLLFSATLPHWIHNTANKYLRPERKHVDLVGDDRMKTSKTVQHLAIRCSYQDRPATIGAVLQVYSGIQGRTMIFCETKRDADELVLSKDLKLEAHVIHGDVPQDKREMVLKGFREGRYRCLIGTDVAARGLDIPEVDLVIQCCPPKDIESYIHRSGRTGRAGRDGTCILFYKPNEEYGVYDVERRAGITFKKVGPPTPSDIINASVQEASKSLTEIPESVYTHFKQQAENLLKEHEAVNLLAAALAVVSGNGELKPRSLLTSREGFTTYIFRTNIEMRGSGYAWKALERCVTAELKDQVQRTRLLADKKGCVFDLPTELVNEFEQQWQDGKFDTITKATELPELAPQEFSSGSYGGNNSYSRQGGRGFSRGRGGNSRNYGGGGRSWGGNRRST